MKTFWIKFLIVILGIGMLCPTWLTGSILKASAASYEHEYYNGESITTYSEKTPGSWSDDASILVGGRKTSTADEWAMWEFTPSVDGDYKVSANWVIDTNQTDSANFAVVDKNGINPAVTLNQRLDADGVTVKPDNTVSKYKNLGTYQFLSGVLYSIKLDGDITATKHLFAGHIKIEHENVKPSAPILITPVNDNETTDMTPTFSWNPSVDPDDTPPLKYELFVSNVADFSNLVINKSGLNSLTDTSFTPSADLSEATYYWQVRAFDGEDYSTKSLTNTFTVKSIDLSRPQAPTNLLASVGDGEISLTWDEVAGADYYNVYYQKNTAQSYVGPISVFQTATKITQLENGQLYRLIVRSVGANGNESENAWLEATPVTQKVVPVAAVVKTTTKTPVAPTKQVETQPKVEQGIDQGVSEPEVGKILGEEKDSSNEEKINWTPWIILFILIILAGAATGGYFYWFGQDEDEEIITKEILAKNGKSSKKSSKTNKSSARKNDRRW